MDNTTKLKTLAELSLCDGVTVSNEGNRYDFLEADIKASDHDDAYARSAIYCCDHLNDRMVISEDTFEASGWIDFSDAERAEFHRLQQCILADRDQLDLFDEPRAQCSDCDGTGKQELRTDVDAYDVLRCRTCDGRGDIPLNLWSLANGPVNA